MTKRDTLTFFYYPRACSLAVHIALEEVGLEYDRVLVNIIGGQNREPEYMRINPTGAVPALRIGDYTLTETHAILTWLGDVDPAMGLLPSSGNFLRYRAHQLMNFLSSSVHTYIRGIFRPAAYTGENPAAEEVVRQHSLVNLAKAVDALETRLGDGPWALGDQYSVVDAYLFVMYLWSTDERIASVPERPRWETIARNVWQRPPTRRAVEVERRDRNYPIPESWN